MKLKRTILAAVAISMAMSSTAFAGTWRTGAEPNQNRWWYDFDNGTYAANGWLWIDGDNNGVAECYYFDAEGWMLADTVTPDGYTVNADGAWTENGIVQTQAVQIQVAQTEEEQAPVEQSQSDGVVNADFSGVYRKLGDWPVEYLGLDSSWESVTLTAKEVNGNMTVVVNGITASDVSASADGLKFNIPDTNCAAFRDGDGILTIFHLAAADRVNYEKIN